MPKDGSFRAPSLDRIVWLGAENPDNPGNIGVNFVVLDAEYQDRERSEIEQVLGSPYVGRELSIVTRFLPGRHEGKICRLDDGAEVAVRGHSPIGRDEYMRLSVSGPQ